MDCLHNFRWYCSTVIEAQQEKKTMKYLVGFRRYDLDGNKVDMQGKAFYGLNESSDEWIGVMKCK